MQSDVCQCYHPKSEHRKGCLECDCPRFKFSAIATDQHRRRLRAATRLYVEALLDRISERTLRRSASTSIYPVYPEDYASAYSLAHAFQVEKDAILKSSLLTRYLRRHPADVVCQCYHRETEHNPHCSKCNCGQFSFCTTLAFYNRCLRAAVRLFVEAKFSRVSEQTMHRAASLAIRKIYEDNCASASALAHALQVSESAIVNNRLTDRYVRRYKTASSLIGYKSMKIVTDEHGFALRSQVVHNAPLVRSNIIEAECVIKGRTREDAIKHAQERLRCYERKEDFEVCQCGIYAFTDIVALDESGYFEEPYVVVIIQPFGIVEISDESRTIRCTDAIIESVHLTPNTMIDERFILEGVGDSSATTRNLTQLIRDEICQSIADDLNADVVFHNTTRIRYHVNCHKRSDVKVYHPRAYMREVLAILNDARK